MKEKLLWFAIALGLVLVFAQAQTSQAPRAPQVAQGGQSNNGRFQISSLSHIASSGGTTFTATDIYRVDTESGKTWLYIDVLQKDGTLTRHWREIDELQP